MKSLLSQGRCTFLLPSSILKLNTSIVAAVQLSCSVNFLFLSQDLGYILVLWKLGSCVWEKPFAAGQSYPALLQHLYGSRVVHILLLCKVSLCVPCSCPARYALQDRCHLAFNLLFSPCSSLCCSKQGLLVPHFISRFCPHFFFFGLLVVMLLCLESIYAHNNWMA